MLSLSEKQRRTLEIKTAMLAASLERTRMGEKVKITTPDQDTLLAEIKEQKKIKKQQKEEREKRKKRRHRF